MLLYNILDWICFFIVPLLPGILIFDWILIKKYNRIYHIVVMKRWLTRRRSIIGAIILAFVSIVYGKATYLEWTQGELNLLGRNIFLSVYSSVSWIILILYRRMLTKFNIPDPQSKVTART